MTADCDCPFRVMPSGVAVIVTDCASPTGRPTVALNPPDERHTLRLVKSATPPVRDPWSWPTDPRNG
jgi:hypothetical protein